MAQECESGGLSSHALPSVTGGSASGLSATDAWQEPLPVMEVNLAASNQFRKPGPRSFAIAQAHAACARPKPTLGTISAHVS